MIGKTIKSLLTCNSTLTALVPAASIYPYVISAGTDLPSIVFTVDSMEPEYAKGGWVGDEIVFSVWSFSQDYGQLQNIVSAIRDALELNKTGYSTQDINKIYLQGQNEGFDVNADTFYNQLSFNVRINKY